MVDMTDPQFVVVRYATGQPSVWPADRTVPAGWTVAGQPATRDECLDAIEQAGPVTVTPQVDGATLLDLFGAAVAAHPDRTAIRDDTQALTYVTLDVLSGAFARVLGEHGVGRGDTVAFHLDRSVAVFVAMLGILKTGAAFVPVDKRMPEARRDVMIGDSGARVLVTSPDGAGLGASLGVPAVALDLASLAHVPSAEPVKVLPGDAACVLFTSGSSGRPKAIVLEHRNIASFGANTGMPALRPDDRVGHVSSHSFDAFHFEAWCALAAGAEVVVLPAMPDLINQDLQRELRRRRITAMLVPTMAINHVVRADREAFSSLRVLHTGGDVILPEACRDLLAGGFRGEFYNLYGPTEITCACTAHHITPADLDGDSVPIGRALAGVRVHLLDAELNPVADGEQGEIYVGGPGVARGYLGQPRLTAQRFLPDPFAPGGGRMYATGDLARRETADGPLEFLGRIDDQVKIRGFRVEPREVERLLARHKGLREVAIVVLGEGDGKHLSAIVVADEQVSPRELREFATSNMPDFMVPSSFVAVAEIPANDHGKRDVAQLRALAESQLLRHRDRTAPRNEIERYLAEVWEDLLTVEHVGALDDFFALGGNSLLAFRLQQRINREMGVRLDTADVLSTSELGDLAALISQRKEAVAS